MDKDIKTDELYRLKSLARNMSFDELMYAFQIKLDDETEQFDRLVESLDKVSKDPKDCYNSYIQSKMQYDHLFTNRFLPMLQNVQFFNPSVQVKAFMDKINKAIYPNTEMLQKIRECE